MKISGYLRPDGSVGLRNHVAVLPSVGCANDLALRLGRMYPDVLLLTHRQGCSQLGADNDQTFRTLAGLGKNPNIAGVLVVGLGCETIPAENLADEISKTKKMVEYLDFLDDEGLMAAIPKGARILDGMLHEASQMTRVPCGTEQLTLGLKCGLSDTTSGISSNPATGIAADKVIESRGKVILSETPELIGAERVLAKRAASRDVEEKLYRVVNEFKERAKASDMDLQEANVAPGNIAGGITTIEEKSLGSVMREVERHWRGCSATGRFPKGKACFSWTLRAALQRP